MDDSLDKFCQKHNIIAWYKVSAKDNININEGMDSLISRIIHQFPSRNNMINISQTQHPKTNRRRIDPMPQRVNTEFTNTCSADSSDSFCHIV